jgi:hypothetical protein
MHRLNIFLSRFGHSGWVGSFFSSPVGPNPNPRVPLQRIRKRMVQAFSFFFFGVPTGFYRAVQYMKVLSVLEVFWIVLPVFMRF